VTQYRPGRYLAVVQQHLAGRALLCIDVSGSMDGAPLHAAIAGGLDFLVEARDANYRCGLVLWNGRVVAHLPTTSPDSEVRKSLRGAHAGGGTNLAPALRAAVDELAPLTGDRVVCVFGDGDVGDAHAVAELAKQARAAGIRFVVRGLGRGVADQLAELLTPLQHDEARSVSDVTNVRGAIASMASALRARR